MRGALALAGMGCVFLLLGCDGEPEFERGEAAPEIAGEIAGPTSPIIKGREGIRQIREVFGGSGSALIVGSVSLRGGRKLEPSRLSVEIDGRPARQAETSVLPGDESTLLLACACDVEPDEHAVELVLDAAVENPIAIRSSSLAVSDNLEFADVDAPGLPQPLVAAGVEPGKSRIRPTADELVEADLARGLGTDDLPLLLIGQVDAITQTPGLGSIQIDGLIGTERLQPAYDIPRPGSYTGLYDGTGHGGESVGLRSGTAAGSTPVGPRVVFACACQAVRGY